MKEDLEKYQCNLWKREDIEDEHYLVAIPEQHYTVGMDQMKFEQVEVAYVPSHTHFSKLPHFNNKTSKKDLIEKLREQLEYWQLQMSGKVADQWNKMGGSDPSVDMGKTHDSYYRYMKRAEACCKFLDALQESPRRSDTHIFHDHYEEVEYPNEN